MTRITYETSVNEPIHPDITVAARMREFALSTCEFGCKLYRDPLSNVVVLGHNSNYGCNK